MVGWSGMLIGDRWCGLNVVWVVCRVLLVLLIVVSVFGFWFSVV